MRKLSWGVAMLLIVTGLPSTAQNSNSDEAGRVLGLENAWGHAIEAKDTKALDQLLAPTFLAVEIDGSVSSKAEFLAGIKAPERPRTQPFPVENREDIRNFYLLRSEPPVNTLCNTRRRAPRYRWLGPSMRRSLGFSELAAGLSPSR